MQRLFMVNSALQSPTAFKTSPLVPEHVSWAIWCVTVYGYIHPGSTCPETTGQCWEHGYSETTDNVNIWPGLGEHQVLAGGYHPLSDFYYWQRNVDTGLTSALREPMRTKCTLCISISTTHAYLTFRCHLLTLSLYTHFFSHSAVVRVKTISLTLHVTH